MTNIQEILNKVATEGLPEFATLTEEEKRFAVLGNITKPTDMYHRFIGVTTEIASEVGIQREQQEQILKKQVSEACHGLSNAVLEPDGEIKLQSVNKSVGEKNNNGQSR